MRLLCSVGRRLLAVACVLGWLHGGAPAALSHEFWADPSHARPRVGQELAVRLLVGDHLEGEEFPRSAKHCVRFEFVSGEGTQRIEGETRLLPAGRVTPRHAGLSWIVYRSGESVAEVEPAKFGPYLEAEGHTRWLADWKRRDPEGKQMVREAFSRCVKSLVAVEPIRSEAPVDLLGSAATGFDRVVGLDLEIVPEANPLALRPGDELPVRLLWQGQPLAQQQVSALHPDDARKPIRVVTDAEGRARLRLPRTGFWLLACVHFAAAKPDEDLWYRSTWASLTFHMPRPVVGESSR